MSTQLRFIRPSHQQSLSEFFNDDNFVDDMTLNLDDMTLIHSNKIITCSMLPSRSIFEYYFNDQVQKVALLLEKFKTIETEYDIRNKDIFTRYQFRSQERKRTLNIIKNGKSRPTIYQAFIGSFMPNVYRKD